MPRRFLHHSDAAKILTAAASLATPDTSPLLPLTNVDTFFTSADTEKRLQSKEMIALLALGEITNTNPPLASGVGVITQEWDIILRYYMIKTLDELIGNLFIDFENQSYILEIDNEPRTIRTGFKHGDILHMKQGKSDTFGLEFTLTTTLQ